LDVDNKGDKYSETINKCANERGHLQLEADKQVQSEQQYSEYSHQRFQFGSCGSAKWEMVGVVGNVGESKVCRENFLQVGDYGGSTRAGKAYCHIAEC